MDCDALTGVANQRSGCLSAGFGIEFRLSSLGNEQPTQNWSGQGESDCLIKTKHCDALKRR